MAVGALLAVAFASILLSFFGSKKEMEDAGQGGLQIGAGKRVGKAD